MNGRAIRAVMRKDLRLFFVVLPLAAGLGSPALERGGRAVTGVTDLLGQVSPALRAELAAYTPAQVPVVLLGLYLLAPIYLIVPIMVSSVIGADSFAGEKERRTFEALAYSPITDRELFLAKVAVAWVPAVLISLMGFVAYGLTLNLAAWPVMGKVFFPNATWVLLALWVAPGVAALALGATVLVSARVQTFQEAFQLGGVVVLPLILLVVGQVAGVVYLGVALAAFLGLVVWGLALALLWFGARSFQRTGMLARA